ncbi:hypothetical protein [Tateyamaria omphalii]|uniref:Uncharacterized protein n=1 Tax=Tateyamaria omphalii TaxID=299262 RepID=A0A1P8MWR9_9RHOB|nr:hypothetical protein [Tateyamaria omphalii]APX12432.1 hypothetical protein BWR18_12650 [Tateyamaria omphalii]
MPFDFDELECNIFGDFKAGDNAGYNSELLSELVEANENGRFNKPILLQAASLIEVAAIQIFYRAQNYNLEGVPNVREADRQEIEDKQIDKFAVVIDNLRKYHILDGMSVDIYDELHKLRKYRNKIHIQLDVNIPGVHRDEDRVFTGARTLWAVDLNWRVLSYLAEQYSRPNNIQGFVRPLRLPRLA